MLDVPNVLKLVRQESLKHDRGRFDSIVRDIVGDERRVE